MLMSVVVLANEITVNSFSENQTGGSSDLKTLNADGLPFLRLEAVKNATRRRKGKIVLDPETGKPKTYNAIIPVMANPFFDSSKPEGDDNKKEILRVDLALLSWDLDTKFFRDYEVFHDEGREYPVMGTLHREYQRLDGIGASPDAIWPALAEMFKDGGILCAHKYTRQSPYGGRFMGAILDFVKTKEEHADVVKAYQERVAAEKAEKAQLDAQ